MAGVEILDQAEGIDVNKYRTTIKKPSTSLFQGEESMFQDKEAQMLDLLSKVQMFQIATEKVNSTLKQRSLEPVFKLKTEEEKKKELEKK